MQRVWDGSSFFSFIYFLTAVVQGTYVVMNLFLAVRFPTAVALLRLHWQNGMHMDPHAATHCDCFALIGKTACIRTHMLQHICHDDMLHVYTAAGNLCKALQLPVVN